MFLKANRLRSKYPRWKIIVEQICRKRCMWKQICSFLSLIENKRAYPFKISSKRKLQPLQNAYIIYLSRAISEAFREMEKAKIQIKKECALRFCWGIRSITHLLFEFSFHVSLVCQVRKSRVDKIKYYFCIFSLFLSRSFVVALIKNNSYYSILSPPLL